MRIACLCYVEKEGETNIVSEVIKVYEFRMKTNSYENITGISVWLLSAYLNVSWQESKCKIKSITRKIFKNCK